jgi:hypothetical protein
MNFNYQAHHGLPISESVKFYEENLDDYYRKHRACSISTCRGKSATTRSASSAPSPNGYAWKRRDCITASIKG